jgi:hypothetical protein
VFHEPRAKGATVRSLKALLGEDVQVEDHTLAGQAPAAAKAGSNGAHQSAAVAPTRPKRASAKKAAAPAR